MNIYQLLIICLIIHCIEPLFQDKLLTKILEKNETKNIMISPFSIYQVFSILSNGPEDVTQKEILQVIFPDNEIEDNYYTLTQINNNLLKY